MVSPDAVDAIRAWYRLDRAFETVNQVWRTEHGVTGGQVAVLRIVAEREEWLLAELRERLSMHPATLGQLLTRLESKSLVVVRPAADDGRRRHVAVTAAGAELLTRLPLVGPVRLRTGEVDPGQLRRLTDAFTEAVELFGLADFAPTGDPAAPPKARDLGAPPKADARGLTAPSREPATPPEPTTPPPSRPTPSTHPESGATS